MIIIFERRNELESRIIAKRQQIERELKTNRAITPEKRKYLIARLAQLERECGVFNFTKTELKTNDISYGKVGEVRSQAHYVPLASWVAADSGENPQNQNAPQEPKPTNNQAKDEAMARLAMFESETGKPKLT
jgi:hypothetical protein